MQQVRKLLLAILLIASCRGASAQDSKGLDGSLGLHFPIRVSDAVDARIGFTGSLRYPVWTSPSSGKVSAQLQYSLFTARGNRYVHLLLPELEYTPNFFPNSRWEVGIGAGPLIAWNNANTNATDLGITLALRYRLPRGSSAEVRYLRGPKEGESGILMSLVFPLHK